MQIFSGKWVSPTVNGERPPPCNNFSLVSLTSDTFVLFGGFALDDWSNTVYLGHCTDSTIVSTVTYFYTINICYRIGRRLLAQAQSMK